MDQPGPSCWTLQVSEETANGCRILVLRGRLGFAAVHTLEAALSRAASPRGLILDLAGVDYISSGALQVLERHGRTNQPVIVAGACDAVKLTLEFSGTTDLIVTASRTEALARLGPHQGN
jgi:anti-anti-sigma factor